MSVQTRGQANVIRVPMSAKKHWKSYTAEMRCGLRWDCQAWMFPISIGGNWQQRNGSPTHDHRKLTEIIHDEKT
jgi:hypothetical protein